MLTITLLWCGFSLYVVRPAEAKGSTKDFANWLTTVTKKSSTEDLQKQLEELKKSETDLNSYISQVSRIVSRNNEDFNLPVRKAAASNQIYQVLLLEWNQFQTGTGMANVPPPETVKSTSLLQIDKFGSVGFTAVSYKTPVQKNFYLASRSTFRSINTPESVTPMSEGIAIGAP